MSNTDALIHELTKLRDRIDRFPKHIRGRGGREPQSIRIRALVYDAYRLYLARTLPAGRNTSTRSNPGFRRMVFDLVEWLQIEISAERLIDHIVDGHMEVDFKLRSINEQLEKRKIQIENMDDPNDAGLDSEETITESDR